MSGAPAAGPPRLLLAAPKSGSGKTTVACALLGALLQSGVVPAAFKCGPDYIDPLFHERALGVRCRNLDLFLLPPGTVRRLLCQGAAGADVAVLEGAMGYYDGIAATTGASAYELALETQTPVVLVLDCRGAAASLAATARGFLALRQDSGIAGVVLNRVSPSLYRELREFIERETGVPAYGYLPPLPSCALESRHLGLVAPNEARGLAEKLARLAAQGAGSLDLNGLLALARRAPPLIWQPGPAPPAAGPVDIALARDEAFFFYYHDALALLEALGARLVPFSPLADAHLPPGVGGLLLGGGYPELHAARLAQNRALLADIARAVAGGMPCLAECGGHMLLHESLEGADGRAYPMAGVVEGRCYRGDGLKHFGYVTLRARADNVLCDAGETLPAHEFHYWQSTGAHQAFEAQKPLRGTLWGAGVATDTLYAGFPHLHLCGRPQAAARFVGRCAQYAAKSRQLP